MTRSSCTFIYDISFPDHTLPGHIWSETIWFTTLVMIWPQVCSPLQLEELLLSPLYKYYPPELVLLTCHTSKHPLTALEGLPGKLQRIRKYTPSLVDDVLSGHLATNTPSFGQPCCQKSAKNVKWALQMRCMCQLLWKTKDATRNYFCAITLTQRIRGSSRSDAYAALMIV